VRLCDVEFRPLHRDVLVRLQPLESEFLVLPEQNSLPKNVAVVISKGSECTDQIAVGDIVMLEEADELREFPPDDYVLVDELSEILCIVDCARA